MDALADDVIVEQVTDDGKIIHVVFGTPQPLLLRAYLGDATIEPPTQAERVAVEFVG